MIPQQLALILPVIVIPLSAWLNEDHLPQWANAVLSAIIVLLCAFLWALFSNSIAGDLVADFILLASYCAALMAGPLAPLHKWLMIKLPSPLLLLAPRPAPTQPITPPVLRASRPPASSDSGH